MIKRYFLYIGLLVLFFFSAALNVYSLGKSENETTRFRRDLTRIEVSGRVRLVGNSQMSFLVITGEIREWYIDDSEIDKLMHLQQQNVTVKGQEYFVDRYFANGMLAGRYYYLKNITVVNPKK